MLYFLIVLAYWERLISSGIMFVVVSPSHRNFFFITELATPLGSFLVVFLWGLGIQCALIDHYFSVFVSGLEVCMPISVL